MTPLAREHPRNAVVVGASLSGLMAGLALARSGMHVTILERVAAFTRTGAAIGLNPARLAGLARLGAKAAVARASRQSTLSGCTWYALHESIRATASADRRIQVRTGVTVRDVGQDEGSAWAITGDGDTIAGDLLIGADGHRSVVRRRVAPGRPDASFAGYLIWLGLSEEKNMPAVRRWPTEVAMLNPVDGYFFGYPVPDLGSRDVPGMRQLGWAWYDASRNALLRETGCVVDTVVQQSLTGDRIGDATYRALAQEARDRLPLPWRDAVIETIGRRAVIGTPIAEYVPERLVNGRLALVGDAAHVPTPMTGSGFAASIDDAEALGAAFDHSRADVARALGAYEQRRLAAARRLVQSGQQFSRSYAREAA